MVYFFKGENGKSVMKKAITRQLWDTFIYNNNNEMPFCVITETVIGQNENKS